MCEKIASALCISLLGFLMVPACLYLIFWNESNQVCTAAAYKQAASSIVEDKIASSIATNKTNNGFLPECDPTGKRGDFVHLECPVDDSLSTSEASTGITVQGAYQVDFVTEQYAYTMRSESQSKSSDSSKTESCHCYSKQWTTSPVTSITTSGICRDCRNDANINLPFAPSGTSVATSMGYQTVYASSVPLGNSAFVIGQDQIANIAFKPRVSVPITPDVTVTGSFIHTDANRCGASGSETGCWYSSALRQDKSCTVLPCSGDQRITVTAYGSEFLSVVGREAETGGPPVVLSSEDFGGSALPPCKERSVFYASDGQKSAATLFEELDERLSQLTTVLRVVSFCIMWLGFYMMVYPIEAVVDLIPCIGDCLSPMVGCVLALFALVAGASSWSLAFSLSWIFYRPVIGIPLLVISLGCAYYAIKMQRDQKKELDDDEENDEEAPEE